MWPRWVRALTTIWVALDSRKRGKFDVVWTLTILLFGPLLLPFYMAIRPAMKGEKHINNYIWRLFNAFETLAQWAIGLAASAVFIENITTPKRKELAEVKRAEIKAITIVLIGLEKFGWGYVKEYIEDKYLS